MSARPAATRRLLVALAALVATLAGGVAVAPSAAAAPQTRYFTAGLAPGSVTPGVPAAMTLTVKNTSTAVSALDRVRLTIPAGFTVAGPFVVSRAGWTASLTDATTLTAKTLTPLRSGLLRGQSLTITLSATTAVGFCPTSSVAWPVRADGILLPFVLQGSAPTVTVTPSATCTNVGLVPGQDATLVIPGAAADLGNGASGTVALYSQECIGEGCFGSDTVVTLSGSFKASDEPLYGFDGEGPLAPATMTLTCSAGDCPYAPLQEPAPRYGHWHCYEPSCPDYDPASDLASYPVWVALETSTPGVYGDYVEAQPCDENREPVEGAKFCVDVDNMTRPLVGSVENCSYGDLSIPVLFASDPKFIVGR